MKGQNVFSKEKTIKRSSADPLSSMPSVKKLIIC